MLINQTPQSLWNHLFRSQLVVLVFLLSAVSAGLAQNPTTATATIPPPRLFRIGYLEAGQAARPDDARLEAFREALTVAPAIREEFQRAGFRGAGLFPADSPGDMIRRLNAKEFDLVFAPANLYDEQSGGYTVILKSRRPGDRTDPSGDMVSRTGVVFVSSRHPRLFSEELSDREVANELSRERIAAVSTQSVAGFHAALLEIVENYGRVSLASGYTFFDSSEDVVKGVLSGLAHVGACERTAFEKVFEDYRLPRDEYVRVLLITRPVITDPVLLHPALSPRSSSLGRRIRQTMLELSRQDAFGTIEYVESNDEEYRRLRETLRAFREKVDLGQ